MTGVGPGDAAKIDGVRVGRQARKLPCPPWLGLLAALTLTGCNAEDAARSAATGPAASLGTPKHSREILFVGDRGGDALAASLVFRTADGRHTRSREARGWVGHAGRWEGFLDERWSTPAAGGPWAIVPHGPLRIAAGVQSEVEALWYREAGRALRLDLERPLSTVSSGARGRLHLYDGVLELGGERTPGAIVEVLRTAAAASGEGEELQILLVGGGDLVLLHSHEKESAGERNSGWMQRDGEVRTWAAGMLRPLGERILPEARRGIPRGWRFDVPTLGASATLHATGFISEIGAERTGRRGVEVRYTLEGWLTLDGSRVPVRGAALYRVP